jgi:hypothetical protein
MRSIFLLAALTALHLTVVGQSVYYYGEIITRKGEHRKGFINEQFRGITPKYIEFKENDLTITRYTPSDLEEFRIGDYWWYKARNVVYSNSPYRTDELTFGEESVTDQGREFLRVLVDGNIQLLHLNTFARDIYFIESKGQTTELRYHAYKKKIGDNSIRLEKRYYVSQLNLLFSACPAYKAPNKLEYAADDLSLLISSHSNCNETPGRILYTYSDYYPGTIQLSGGTEISGSIRKFTQQTLNFIEFKSEDQAVSRYFPKDLNSFITGDGNRYLTQEVLYDSSVRPSDIIPPKTPNHPIPLFMRLVFQNKTSLYHYVYKDISTYFIESKGRIQELSSRTYEFIGADGKFRGQKKEYVETLRVILSDCPKIKISNALRYSEKEFINLLSQYAICETGTK